MDLHEPAERERSEPCSAARTNPFTDEEESARKRQRTANGSSRSRSVDASGDLALTTGSSSQSPQANDKQTTPQTPPNMSSEPNPEPTSSRVTINLRTNRSLPAKSPSPSSPIHEKGATDTGTRRSIESESDALSTIPPIETPSSSPSESGSPRVELVPIDEDPDVDDQPPLAIISDDEDSADPMQSFPFARHHDTTIQAVHKVSHALQYDEIEDQGLFCEIRDWIDGCLQHGRDPASFYNMYTNNRDVWTKFPDLIWALSNRSRFFGQFLQRSREGRQALTDMLAQFARLAGRFLLMDVWTLDQRAMEFDDDDSHPDLASYGYLYAFSFLLRKDEQSHIGRNLETHYSWNWDEDVTTFTECFQGEGGTISGLTKLAKGLFKLVDSNPKLVEHFTEPCRIVARIVAGASATLKTRDAQNHDPEEKVTVDQGYIFYKVMSSYLEVFIEKYVTNISSDATVQHLTNLTAIYLCALTYVNVETSETVERFNRAHPRIIRKSYVTKAISYTWKFAILKSLVTSAQMQLRVIGVATMCTDLLYFYNLDKTYDASENPLLLYFTDVVLRSQIVDYIVGIGSHPEIIHESYNILGFLIVTKTYDEQQTDKIWQTVMTSQDPRVVGAILRMVSRSLHLFELGQVFYLCKKLDEVPIQAFSSVMRDFCFKVLEALVTKCNNDGYPIGTIPCDLCVRLIRESSVTRNDAPVGYPDIQNFALNRLHHLLQFGPSTDCRHKIYQSCIQDVSSGSRTTQGSICVISALLRRYPNDLRVLTTEQGLTQLMVKELELTNTRGSSLPSLNTVNTQGASACLEILSLIINTEPSTISSGLGKRLWDALVGTEAKTVIDRNISWQILNNAAKRSPQHNVFLLSCFRDHFPDLPAHCFTSGSLEFAKEVIRVWMEELRNGFVEEERKFESQALEQLWRIILTAPPNTVDSAAIKSIVGVFVDSDLILSLPRAKSRAIHLALVERCLEQLKSAATKLKEYNDFASAGSEEKMAVVASENQFQEQEMIFARSLAVLREFLKAHQAKPQFAIPKSRPLVLNASTSVDGEPLTLKYQSFDGDHHTEVKSVTLGKSSTAASLLASLQEATGFKSYKVFCDGKQFDPDEIEVCKSLEDLNLRGLILVQRREDFEGSPGHHSGSSKTTLELEIMKHIKDLWGYLGMHDKVAQEIHYFLIQFPVYGRLLDELKSESTPYSDIFPVGQPFKSLYAIHVLMETVLGVSHLESFSGPTLTRAISLIVGAISDSEVLEQSASDELRDCLAMNFVGCLVQLLREPILPPSIGDLLTVSLFERLLQFLKEAQSVIASSNSIHLTLRSFEAMLESSLHSPDFWKLFSSHLSTTSLLRELLLDEPRPMIRKSIMKHIVSRCTFAPSLALVPAIEITVTLWPLVSSLVPEAVLQPHQCDETFALCLTLFRKLGESPVQLDSLGGHVDEWGTLLISYQSNDRDDCPENVDTVALGLANLLQAATMLAKASQQDLSCGVVGTELFRGRLFPDLSKDDDILQNGSQRLPLLHSPTREKLAETIFLLVKDDEAEYKKIMETLVGLVPYSDHDEDDPYSFDLPFLFDRFKAVRSQTGYVGLRNLSNTCYLNSLFTQLFMNISFRQFMLGLRVSDGVNQQKLLSETQNLFSNMQNSVARFVDPANLASSIQTYDLSNIDVSIQMDVDEFYNLLFDRWEGQILTQDAKRKFKSFFGGQLVQQVKSKECDHISEREESFSAIQCDIKGKTCLEESLQAYVEGEIMEGDNKYKCSTCDRHVDAVKRACLKDVPDNLIFHLKRFDFNLRTLQRSKINDHFAFPRTIDMRPYKVEHIMENPEGIPEDIFELVGVLVHSGTAESGHYYSYIRERPSSCDKQTWVEFNDETVSPWDSVTMENCCFGGPEARPLNGDAAYDKSYSAYMLFYQRSSDIAEQNQWLEKSKGTSPVRLDTPAYLATHIAMENELLLRKYCLYEPSHTYFVSKMMGNLKKINGGQCSASHDLEKSVLRAVLNHMDQVVARAKDTPQFSSYLGVITKACQSCAECSRDYIEWYCDCSSALRNLLLRNPDGGVRIEISSSILAALKKIKLDASYAYGLDDDDNADDMDESDQPQVIHRFADSMVKLYEVFHTNSRAWPEYFGLLGDIARLGREEAVILLDRGYLRKTMEIISADPLLPLGQQYLRMFNIISKRLATRPVSYDAVIDLACKLLQTCDSSIDPVHDTRLRLRNAVSGEPIPLVSTERHLLVQHWTRNFSHILTEKLLRINQNEAATRAIMIYLLEWQYHIDHNICQAILCGIRNNPSTPFSAPSLKAALVYCEYSEEESAISSMIQEVAKVAYTVDNAEGKEFLQFFRDVCDISVNKSNTPRDDILRFVTENASMWGPGLLTSYDPSVRQGAEALIQETITRYGPDVNFGPDDKDDERAAMIIQAAQNLGIACLEFIQDTYIRQRAAAVRATMMNIQIIIEACASFFEDDDKDADDRRFFERKASVLSALRKCLVEEADEETSDWEASDVEYSDQSIGQPNEDLNDVDVNI